MAMSMEVYAKIHIAWLLALVLLGSGLASGFLMQPKFRAKASQGLYHGLTTVCLYMYMYIYIYV